MSEVGAKSLGRGQVYVSMAVLFLVILVANIDRYVFAVILDPVKHTFDLTDAQAGLLVGAAFAFFFATLGIPVARFADVGNRRNIISIAIALWSAATLLCGYAQSHVQIFIFRVAVGVGEAGGAPPTHSLIASYFPPQRRAVPYALIYVGAMLGSVIAVFIGGWLTQHYGWRVALIALGASGIPIALLAYFLVIETRGAAPLPSPVEIWKESLKAGRELFSNVAYRQLAIAYMLFGFVSFSTTTWDIAFYTRTFTVSIEEATKAVGLVGLISGIVGVLAGGFIGNRLAKRSLRWLAYFPAICLVLCLPFFVVKYFLLDFHLSIAAMAVGATLMIAFVGPFFAAVQAVVKDAERSTAVAIAIFLANIMGLGLAPYLIGRLSDHIAVTLGAQSLRYAIPILYLALPGAAFYAWRAGRNFKV